MAGSARIISLHSHKGGTGKTTLALGLASLLAEEFGHDAVYLIDADLTGASMDYVFPDLNKASKHLGDYLIQDPFQSERISLEDLVWDITVPHDDRGGSGVRFHGISSTADFTQVRNTMPLVYKSEHTGLVRFRIGLLIGEIADECKTNSVYIIIDNSPGLAEASVETLKITQEKKGVILFVATPDRADLLGLLDQVRELVLPIEEYEKGKTSTVLTVVNRVEEAAILGIDEEGIADRRVYALDHIKENLGRDEDLKPGSIEMLVSALVFFRRTEMEYQFYLGERGPYLHYFKYPREPGFADLLHRVKEHFEE